MSPELFGLSYKFHFQPSVEEGLCRGSFLRTLGICGLEGARQKPGQEGMRACCRWGHQVLSGKKVETQLIGLGCEQRSGAAFRTL